MKKFKVKCEDKNYIVNAKSEAEAVKKLRDAKAKKLGDAHTRVNVGCAEITVNNEAKAYSVGSVTCINGRDERTFRDYAKKCIDVANKIKELESKGYSEGARAYDSAIKDAEPIIVEAIPYKNEMYVVLEFSWNGSKRWIVVAKENYHNEKKYTGGGSVEYSLNEAKKTADDFYTMNKLDKKYGRTEGYKRWMRGETDSYAEDKKFCPSMKDETEEEKERKAQEWVDYDIKHYGKVSEQTKEDIKKMGLDFDKWDNQVEDSAATEEKLEISDANKRTYLDRNEIVKIESEARSLRGNWISIYVGVDADKEGYFIDEMYINTTGTWLYKLSDIKEYMRELDNANKFMNKYEKFAENRRA